MKKLITILGILLVQFSAHADGSVSSINKNHYKLEKVDCIGGRMGEETVKGLMEYKDNQDRTGEFLLSLRD